MRYEQKDIRKDHNLFTHTAMKSKRVNVRPVLTRGGIRL